MLIEVFFNKNIIVFNIRREYLQKTKLYQQRMKRQPELITLVMILDRFGLDMFLFVYCKQDFLN